MSMCTMPGTSPDERPTTSEKKAAEVAGYAADIPVEGAGNWGAK